MRSFSAPAVLGLVFQGVGGLGGAVAGAQAGGQQADALEAQARGVEVQGARELRDERTAQKFRTSRMLALAAAGGRGSDLLQTISADLEESALRQHRIGADTATQARNLRFQGKSIKAQTKLTPFDIIDPLMSNAIRGRGSASVPSTSLFMSGSNSLSTKSPTPRTNSAGRLSGPV